MNNISKILSGILIVVIMAVLLLSVKGAVGNPSNDTINDNYWVKDGPFESSSERGRFALAYSYVEDRSVDFALPLAAFAAPDLAYYKGNFVSLFAPGVSFAAIPGYIVGRALGASRVGAFATITLFAFLNTFLIAKIARKFGADLLSSFIASAIFIFASPAFSYATTLYQHHLSVFLILLSLCSLFSLKDFSNLLLVLFLYALGVVVDYPNGLLMAPIVVYSFLRIFKGKVLDGGMHIDFNFLKPIAVIALVPPILFMLWFNRESYDSPFRISAVVPRAVSISDEGKPLFYSSTLDKQISEDQLDQLEQKGSIGFFKTRRIINGLDVHIFSSDRGILYFTPVMILGLIGMVLIGKKKNISVFWAILGINLILYSMWGDPWGGWTFGSRYLIPGYAVLSIFIPFFLKKIRKNLLLISIALILVGYSVVVNSLGALTSTANPPKIEAQELSVRQNMEFKYTYERNIDLLLDNSSRSFIYNSYLKDTIFVWEYFYVITLLISISLLGSICYVTLFQKVELKKRMRRERK